MEKKQEARKQFSYCSYTFLISSPSLYSPYYLSEMSAIPSDHYTRYVDNAWYHYHQLIRWVCGSSADRISNLPADVVQRILVLLPIKDAAKMATLSRKWRRHWRSIPQLVFVGSAFAVKQGGSESTELMMNRLLFNINKALLLHDGPITKFVLTIPGLSTCCGNEIDQIILYLSDSGLQTFSLHFSPGDEQIYKLHPALFSCPHLDYLSLEFCEVSQPSSFVGFSKLTGLHLRAVTLPADFFENFLLKCPMLKLLVLDNCDGPTNFQVVTPCLQKFVFVCCYVQKICFKYTPLLSTVVIALGGHAVLVNKPVDMEALFASLPALQKLGLDLQLVQYLAPGPAPARLPTPPPNRLTSVRITHLDFGSLEKTHAFVSLITSLPNLLDLSIMACLCCRLLQRAVNGVFELGDTSQPAATTVGSLLEAEYRRQRSCSNRCLQQLREFKIEECLTTQGELDLLKFMLATAPQLETVHILPSKLCSEEFSEFMEEVMSYKPVSEGAKVIYDSK